MHAKACHPLYIKQLHLWNAPLPHDDVIKWKHFPRYWHFVRGIHRSPVNSPHKGQWRGALMFSLICVLINGWVNNREDGNLRRYRAHYDVTLMHFIRRIRLQYASNRNALLLSKRNLGNVCYWCFFSVCPVRLDLNNIYPRLCAKTHTTIIYPKIPEFSQAFECCFLVVY